jgi:hypothetical protein
MMDQLTHAHIHITKRRQWRGGAWSPSSTRSVLPATSMSTSLARWTGKSIEPWPYMSYDVVTYTTTFYDDNLLM